MSSVGALALVLHAHLPFVRHPEYDEFMEEDWLFEAITETYLPLLSMLEALVADDIPMRLTLTLSPSLCEMLSDPLLQSRYRRHLLNLVALTSNELERHVGTALEDSARLYHQRLSGHLERIQQDGGQILPRFRALQDDGWIEIVTCGATHGFLPLMVTEEAVRAQLLVAVQNYARHFGCRPRGIWLPECAYYPGLEHLLAQAGLRYFFVESRGLLHAEPRPFFETAAPVVLANGVAAFARDPESSAQVWSAETGYPGHPHYREFYRDLGWDAPFDTIRPYLHADGFRRNLGIKYHRITGKVPLHKKELYTPALALVRAREDAAHFLRSRLAQLERLSQIQRRPPVIVSPYDAELFGHWWFEGPWFLEAFFRKAAQESERLELTTPARWLEAHPWQQVVQLPMSTWGKNGYAEVWLNEKNRWIYPYLHHCERRMAALAQRYRAADGVMRRALDQAARELLLAQSSDWAFIITQGTTVPYAEKRTRLHVSRFLGLAGQLEQGVIDEAGLAELEGVDCCFPELDYRVYGPYAG